MMVLLLLGCTGTIEPPIPRLVIVGYNQGGEGRLALLEDSILNTATEIDFSVLLERSLTGRLIDYDIVNRNSSRDTLVLLLQDEDSIYLRFFNLRGITPEVPSAFVEDSSKTIVVNQLNPDIPYAPAGLMVSRSGERIAILHDFDSPAIPNVIDIINPQVPDELKLERRNISSLIGSSFYLDQRDNRLYYLVAQAAGARLQYYSLPGNTPITPDITIPDSTTAGNPVVAMSRVGNELIVLQAKQYTTIANLSGTPELGSTVSTEDNSQRLIPSNNERSGAVMILGREALVIHETSSSAAQSVRLTAVSGSLEPSSSGGFIYLLKRDGSLAFFDFEGYQNNPAGGLERRLVNPARLEPADTQFAQPVFISWVIAALDD